VNLLVVIGGGGDESGYLCHIARAAGLGVAWVGEPSQAPAHAYRVIPDAGSVPDAIPPQLARLPNVVGVICLDRSRVGASARLSERFGLPDTLWGGLVVSGRVALLGELAASGVRTPSWRKITHHNDIPSWPGSRVVKLDSPGHAGTYRIGTRWTGGDVMTLAGARPVYAQRWTVGDHIVVQAALRAGQCTAVVAARRVLERLEDTDPAVVVDGHDIDASVALLGLAPQIEQVAQVCGWRAGPVWVDLVMTSAGPVVLDADRGVLGDGLLEAMDLATAGKLGERILGSYAYQRAILSPTTCSVVRAVSQRFVFSIGDDAGGVVRRFLSRMPTERVYDPLTDRNRLSPERVVLRVERGSVIPAMRTRMDRLGYVIAADRAIDTARERAERYAADLYASICLDQDDVDEDDEWT
jgi:hypothetical protein